MKPKNKRPFFSIIVPCYNTEEKYIKRLLSSIYLDFAARDTEVIIVDDNSTDKGFLDVVDDYIRFGKMRIKKVFAPKDMIHCPGNSRELGIQHATGEWITFVDHDDYLTTSALISVKHIIKKYHETRYLSTAFTKIDNGDTRRRTLVQPTSTFIHGKYFNLDNFWKKYDIHFKKDMKLEEDVYICTTANCILENINESKCNYNRSTYVWDINSNSFSKADIQEVNTIMVYFKDYIDATYTVYYDMYKSEKISRDLFIKHAIFNMLSLYTIMEKFFYDYYNDNKNNDKNYCIVLNANIIFVKECIETFKREVNYSNEDIKKFLIANNLEDKHITITNNLFATGHMFFTHTFLEWLDLNSKVDYDDLSFCNNFYKKVDAFEDEYYKMLEIESIENNSEEGEISNVEG